MTPLRRRVFPALGILAGLAVLLGSVPAHAELPSGYDLRVDARSDGGAHVTLTFTVELGAGSTTIPFPYSDIDGLKIVDGPAGATVTASSESGRANLILTTAPAPGEARVTIACDVRGALSEPTPAGQSATIAWLNSQPAPMQAVEILITFPEGTRLHALRESLPKLHKGESGPRALLTSADGRGAVRIRVDRLVQGETLSLKADLTSDSRSFVWWIVGLALSVLYLRSFRDLVNTPIAKEGP